VADTTVKIILCCRFQRTSKVMGQVSVEDMSRNKCFFLFRISHVLCFISICDLFTDSYSYITFTSASQVIVLVTTQFMFSCKLTDIFRPHRAIIRYTYIVTCISDYRRSSDW
jgi:hypothetical protein